MNPVYQQYLDSAEWKATRAWALDELGRECAVCRATENLHIHHLNYDNIGCEYLSDLQVLCKTCHADAHDAIDEARAVEIAREHMLSIGYYLRGKETVPK